MSPQSKVVDISSRSRYKPDLAAIAREQLAGARTTLDMDHEEFAELLSSLLGWEVRPELVESWESGSSTTPGEVLVAASFSTQGQPATDRNASMDIVSQIVGDRYADLTSVYTTRTDFQVSVPLNDLFGAAQEIDAVGISLNLLCQQYPDKHLLAAIEAGTKVRCLFLAPGGEATKTYEAEENYTAGQIAALTDLNIQTLVHRVRDRLSDEAKERLQVAMYDETPRFNLILIDRTSCIMQPYLPSTRGVDSPTFTIARQSATHGLFPMFEQIFNSIWERGELL